MRLIAILSSIVMTGCTSYVAAPNMISSDCLDVIRVYEWENAPRLRVGDDLRIYTLEQKKTDLINKNNYETTKRSVKIAKQVCNG